MAFFRERSVTRSGPPRRSRLSPRGMTAIEAVASLAISAALGVAVAQMVAVSARSRAAIERRADALLAAGNALEVLRAAEPQTLEETADELTGEVAGLSGARMEVTLGEATIGDLPVREIVVMVTERPETAPLSLVGWHLSDPNPPADPEASDAP